MKNTAIDLRLVLLTIGFLIVFSNIGRSSHVQGGQFNIKRLDSLSFEVRMEVLVASDNVFQIPGVLSSFPYTVYGINNSSLTPLGTYTANTYLTDSLGYISNCLSGNILFFNNYMVDTITLPNLALNQNKGVVFEASICCYGNPYNINPGTPVTWAAHVTNMSPISITNTNYPVWGNLEPKQICNNWIISETWDATEVDGDNLVYGFIDPDTSYSLDIPLSSGFGTFFDIPSNPSLTINSISGLVQGQGIINDYYAIGQKVSEYRNSNLYYESYRVFRAEVFSCIGVNNFQAFSEIDTSNWSNATWVNDTIKIQDQNSQIAFNTIDLDQGNFINWTADPGSLPAQYISLSKALDFSTQQGDTFDNNILINLQNIPPQSSGRITLFTTDSNCQSGFEDTLFLPFVFEGISNAGLGDSLIELINNVQDISLFNLLGGNPIPGGVWTERNPSGYLSNGVFLGSQVTQPQDFEFIYYQQQANYPADSAIILIQVIDPNSLTKAEKNTYSFFPNPSEGNVELIISEGSLPFQISIVDSKGSQKRNFLIESNKMTLDLSDLSKGVYFMKSNDSKLQVQKLIIR